MFQTIMSWLAFGLVMAAFVPYARAILRKETKPAVASWIIWGMLDYITFVAMWKQGTVNGQILGACTGVLVIVILAFRHGTAGWSKLDTFCLIGGFTGIGIWLSLDSPFLGMMVSLLVVFTASIPTFVNGWKHPENENKTGWLLFWLSCFPAILSVREWGMADLAQPITFLVIETIMVYLLFVRPRLSEMRSEP